MVFCCVAKLCRESRPFLVQFYVANHSVLVAHFNPKKVVGDNNFFKRSAKIAGDVSVLKFCWWYVVYCKKVVVI